MRPSKSAVIIVNWRRYNLTSQLLTTLHGMKYTGCEAIVIADNETCPDQLAELQQHPVHPRVLASSVNDGYAGAVNRALRDCRKQGYECFFVFNNDIKPMEGFFEEMFVAIRDPRVAFLSPVTLDAQGSLESCGVDVDPLSPYVVHHRMTVPERTEKIYVDSLHGTVLAFTAETLERVGYLDQSYFHCWEETDWCIRAKTMGLQNCILTRAQVYHLGAASLPYEQHYHPVLEYMLMRNMLFFLDKRGFGRECVEAHIEHWLTEGHNTSFREHCPPSDPLLAHLVIERAVKDYRDGRAGIWPHELWAELKGTPPICHGVFSS